MAWEVAAIVLVGTLVRFGLYPLFYFERDLRGGDSGYYLAVGANILAYGVHGETGVPDAYRSPLYSLFAGVVAAAQESAALFYVVHGAVFLGFSIAIYLVLATNKVRFAFLAAVLVAASPSDAVMNGRVLAENLLTPLLVLGTVVFAYAQTARAYILSGLLFGAAALTRDVYILLPLLMFAVGLWRGVQPKSIAIFLIVSVAVTAPWLYRNGHLQSSEQRPDASWRFWVTVWIGTWERNPNWSDPDWAAKPEALPSEALQTLKGISSPAELGAALQRGDGEYFKRLSLNFVRDNPWSVLSAWAARYPRLWFGTRSELVTMRASNESRTWFVQKAALYLLNSMIVVFSVIGGAIAIRSGALPLALLTPIAYTAAIYIPFHNTEPRYSQPVVPLLIVLCAFLIAKAYDTLSARVRTGRLSSPR